MGMRTAMCQEVGGSRLTLEYWAGEHRQRSSGVELGFVLGNGRHWWCIRPCGESLREWEEVDSMDTSHIAAWSSFDDLLETLLTRDETVLVLYPVSKDDEESAHGDDEESLHGD